MHGLQPRDGTSRVNLHFERMLAANAVDCLQVRREVTWADINLWVGIGMLWLPPGFLLSDR